MRALIERHPQEDREKFSDLIEREPELLGLLDEPQIAHFLLMVDDIHRLFMPDAVRARKDRKMLIQSIYG